MVSNATTAQYGVKITTVDPSQRLIEGVFKSGDVRRISLYTVPMAFRWPQVGEAWMVHQANGTWYLDSPWQGDDTLMPVEILEKDELRLDGTTVRDGRGQYVISTLNKATAAEQNYVPVIMPGGTPAWEPITGALIAPGSLTGANLALGSLTAGLIAANSITGGDIANATITSGNIITGAITGDLIAANTITADNIQNGTINSGNITTGSITGSLIAENTITGGPNGNIAQATINSGNITTGAITGNLIATNAITGGAGGNLATGTIDSGNIATGAVTGDVIAINTISGNNIQNATILGGNIATGTVTGSNISVNTITGNNIAPNTITGSLIAANTIVAGLLAAGAVVAGSIAAGAVTAGSIAVGAVSANNISVTSLGAITATLGTVTAGTVTSTTITGGIIQTNVANPKVELSGSGNDLFVTNSSGTHIIQIDTANGLQLSTGGANFNSVTWDNGGVGGTQTGAVKSNQSGSDQFTSINAYLSAGPPGGTALAVQAGPSNTDSFANVAFFNSSNVQVKNATILDLAGNSSFLQLLNESKWRLAIGSGSFSAGGGSSTMSTSVGHGLGSTPVWVDIFPALSTNGAWGGVLYQDLLPDSGSFYVTAGNASGATIAAGTYFFNWVAIG